MIYLLPVLPSTHMALLAALRLLPADAEVIIAGRHSELPDWLALSTVTVYPSASTIPLDMSKGHRVRNYLHAAVISMQEAGQDACVYVPPGSAAMTDELPLTRSETRTTPSLCAPPYTYDAELERTAFILKREGFVPRMYASGCPLKIDSALADITLTRYGYRTHFETMYLRGAEPSKEVLRMSMGPSVAPGAMCHVFNEGDVAALCANLPPSRFESPRNC